MICMFWRSQMGINHILFLAIILTLKPIPLKLASGPPEVAVDTVSASPKSLVYLVGSREAALACDPWFVPVDAAIVGLVDEVDL